MSYRLLEHATDAVVEITASTLEDAFIKAGESVVDIMLDASKIDEKKTKKTSVSGKDLEYLLFNWLEDIIFQVITESFAIKRFDIVITKDKEYRINANLYGERLDLQKHQFRIEIKAPTFHQMVINNNNNIFTMKYLLDL